MKLVKVEHAGNKVGERGDAHLKLKFAVDYPVDIRRIVQLAGPRLGEYTQKLNPGRSWRDDYGIDFEVDTQRVIVSYRPRISLTTLGDETVESVESLTEAAKGYAHILDDCTPDTEAVIGLESRFNKDGYRLVVLPKREGGYELTFSYSERSEGEYYETYHGQWRAAVSGFELRHGFTEERLQWIRKTVYDSCIVRRRTAEAWKKLVEKIAPLRPYARVGSERVTDVALVVSNYVPVGRSPTLREYNVAGIQTLEDVQRFESWVDAVDVEAIKAELDIPALQAADIASEEKSFAEREVETRALREQKRSLEAAWKNLVEEAKKKVVQ